MTKIKMIKFNAILLFALLLLCASCNFKNTNICASNNTNLDIKNPINLGILDDRNCKYDYEEVTFNNEKWGKYALGFDTITDPNNSTRMERYFKRVKPKDGAFSFFSGTCKIESVNDKKPGTYIIQAKGKHMNHVDIDPAICLVSAKKRVKNRVTFFDLYSEEITKRGGRLSKGTRQNIKLATIKKNEAFQLEMKTGFKGNPVHQHYVAIKINGKEHFIDVPDPKSALETGIRYGAYSVDEGTAIIYFKDTFLKNFIGN